MENKIRHVHFQITRNCNLRCGFCGQWGKKGFFKGAPGEEMTFAGWQRIIDELTNAADTGEDMPTVTVWGGEPLVSPLFVPIISLLKERGFKTETVTNGVLINKHKDELKTCVDRLYVSIDGTREIHDSVRGAGVYDTVTQNIKELEHDSVTVMSVITDKLTEVLPEFLGELNKLNIRELFLHDMIGLSKSGIALYKEWMREDFGTDAPYIDSWETDGIPKLSDGLLESVLQKMQGLNFKVTHKKHGNTGVCGSPFSHPHISWNGNVHYCTDFYDFSAGNVKNEGLYEIFRNEKSEKFRNAVKNNRCPACGACSWRNA